MSNLQALTRVREANIDVRLGGRPQLPLLAGVMSSSKKRAAAEAPTILALVVGDVRPNYSDAVVPPAAASGPLKTAGLPWGSRPHRADTGMA